MRLLSAEEDAIDKENISNCGISDQYQDLLFGAFDLKTLKIAFDDISEAIDDHIVSSLEAMRGFINDMRIVIKGHCINLARNFDEEMACKIEDACDDMLNWLDIAPLWFCLAN